MTHISIFFVAIGAISSFLEVVEVGSGYACGVLVARQQGRNSHLGGFESDQKI